MLNLAVRTVLDNGKRQLDIIGEEAIIGRIEIRAVADKLQRIVIRKQRSGLNVRSGWECLFDVGPRSAFRML